MSDKYTPRKGDKVKVTLTGTLSDPGPNFATVTFGDPAHESNVCISDLNHDAVTIELLEPKYEVGALYLDADGEVFRRVRESEPWETPGEAYAYDEDYPTRPLRKLVPVDG